MSGNHFIILGRQKVTLKSFALVALKWQVKKNNLALLALRIQNMPCSVFEDDETVKGWSGQFSRIIIVSDVSEKLSMEEREKVERNDSNETGKNRDLQKQEDPGLSLSPYMK